MVMQVNQQLAENKQDYEYLEEESADNSIIQQEESTKAKSTSLQAFFNLSKFILGVGILQMSHAISQTGYKIGSIVIMIVGILCGYCLLLIVDIVDDMKEKDLTLSGLGYRISGKYMQRLIEICTICIQLSLCLSYTIWIITFLGQISCLHINDGMYIGQLCGHKQIFICIVALFVIPLSFITNLHYFYYVSLISLIIQIIDYIAIYIYNIHLIFTTNILQQSTHYNNIQQIFYLFGVVVFALEGIPVALNVRRSMQNPYNFKQLVLPALILASILYASFGSIVYLAHASKTSESALFDLPLDQPQYVSIPFSYGLTLIFSFSIQITVAFRILENLKFIKQFVFWTNNTNNFLQDTQSNITYIEFRRYLTRILLIICIMLIAYVSPSVNVVISFTGSFFYTILGFIIPCLLYNNYYKLTITNTKKYSNLAILTIGTFFGIFGIIDAYQQMVKEFSF